MEIIKVLFFKIIIAKNKLVYYLIKKPGESKGGGEAKKHIFGE